MKKLMTVLALVLIPSQALAATAAPVQPPVKQISLHSQIGHQIVNGARNVGGDVLTVGRQTFGAFKAVGSDVALSGREVGHAVCATGRATGRGLTNIGNHIQKDFTPKAPPAPAPANVLDDAH